MSETETFTMLMTVAYVVLSAGTYYSLHRLAHHLLEIQNTDLPLPSVLNLTISLCALISPLMLLWLLTIVVHAAK